MNFMAVVRSTIVPNRSSVPSGACEFIVRQPGPPDKEENLKRPILLLLQPRPLWYAALRSIVTHERYTGSGRLIVLV